MPLPLFVPDAAVIAVEHVAVSSTLMGAVPGEDAADNGLPQVRRLTLDAPSGVLAPDRSGEDVTPQPAPSVLRSLGGSRTTMDHARGTAPAPVVTSVPVVTSEGGGQGNWQSDLEVEGASLMPEVERPGGPTRPEGQGVEGQPSMPVLESTVEDEADSSAPSEELSLEPGAEDGAFPPEPAAESFPTASEDEPSSSPDPDRTDGADQPVTVVNGVTLLLRADEQTFDPESQVITAVGDVLVRYGNTQLAADRLWINLQNQYLWAEGEVFFNRNNQIVQGDRAAYNLAQGSGEIYGARGELAVATLEDDLDALATGDPLTTAPIDYRLQGQGSISQVTSPGGFSLATNSQAILFGAEPSTQRKLRFEATTVLFDEDGWYLQDLQITNDPFSPPELIVRGNSARLSRINEDQDELLVDNPQLVFDQGLAVPLLQSRYILNRGQFSADDLNPLPTAIGFDDEDRGGLFIERRFDVGLDGPWRLTVAPQFYVSRWLGESEDGLLDPANYGAVARLTGALGPRTSVTGSISLSGLDLENFSERLRANLRAQQLVGDHTLNLEYSYRDQLFNGTLGFQDVQSSLGLLLASPVYALGDSEIFLQYQGSGQYITANTDDPALITDPALLTDLTDLFRFQGSVTLGRWFPLWTGETPEATPTEGLRFSPRPLAPYVALAVGVTGVGTYYTSDDVQASLEGSVSILGRFGELKRDFLDYTEFNVGFASKLVTEELSPFLFDREVDNNVLSGGVLQQIYGPFLAGFQTSFNVDLGTTINTDLLLEYRRRSYGLVVSFNPVQRTGFVGFRVSDFDWQGQTEPFAPLPMTPPLP